MQTGCQILVKLQDDVDFTQHQYYATDQLRKVFKNSGLRQQPGEKFVSGVTGEPLIDQAIQSDQSDGIGLQTGIQTDAVSQTPSTATDVADGERTPASGDADDVEGGDGVKHEGGSENEEQAIPLHLAMTCETSEDTSMDAMQTDRPAQDEEETAGDEGDDGGGGDVVPRVKIKMEPMDDVEQDGVQDGTPSLYQDQEVDAATSQSNSQLSQFQGATHAPTTSQYLSSLSYQVPATPKPYQCAMCGKAFRSVQVLQKHTHTFHMKTQHVMGVRTGKGRGRGPGRPPLGPPGPRFSQLTTTTTQSSRLVDVTCQP